MIYLIEKGWIDSMENRDADGYRPHSYADTENEAKIFCQGQGVFTVDDCWSVKFYPDEVMPKYRYKPINKITVLINN